MRSFTGVGNFLKDSDALATAVNGLFDPCLIVFTAPFEFFKDTAGKLSEMFPNAEVIGGVAETVVNGLDTEGNVSVLAFFSSDSVVSVGVIPEIDMYPVRMVRELEESADMVNAGDGDTVCFEMCTGSEECLMTTMNSVFESRGIATFGATASAPGYAKKMVSYNERVYDNACVYAVIKNRRGKVKIYRENIYEVESGVAHVVTKADRENRIIFELDGRPACEVYAEETGMDLKNRAGATIHKPMGRAIGNDVYIFAIKKIAENGALYTHRAVTENDEVYILGLCDYDERTQETIDDIENVFGRASLIIAANCVHRHRMFVREGFAKEYYRRIADVSDSQFCIISGGEQYMNQHVNQTMVCAVFE